MCVDVDLFGEVIILKDDVEFWLDNFTRYGGDTTTKRKEQYIKNYPIANIIKAAKLDGSFYAARINVDSQADDKSWLYPTKYKVTNTSYECPSHFHICDLSTCPVFIRRQKQAYSRRMYEMKKVAKLEKLGIS